MELFIIRHSKTMNTSFRSSRIQQRIDSRNSQSRPRLGFGKTVIFLLLFLGIFSFFYIKNTGNITIPEKNYVVDKTVTLNTLNEKLKLWVAPWRYRLYMKFFAPAISLNAWGYVVDSSTTLQNFLTTTLKNPSYTDLTITILPGWNIWDIDDYLAKEEILKAGEFTEWAKSHFSEYQADFPFLKTTKSLEWFLYPDTYRIKQNADADDIIRTLLLEFDKKIGSEYSTLWSEKAYQKLILASIVQREEHIVANKATVAGILEKRINEWILLGADATLCYGYQKTQTECTPTFIASILADKTNPYNSRAIHGYPPTPISNVELTSWEAALNPESSPYYYYLHDASWVIHYARTNDEHNANKAKYLR